MRKENDKDEEMIQRTDATITTMNTTVTKKIIPTAHRGYLSRWTLFWVAPYVQKGFTRRRQDDGVSIASLSADEMPPLDERFDATVRAKEVIALWDKLSTSSASLGKNPSLLRMMWRLERPLVGIGILVGVLQGILSACARPLLLNYLILAYNSGSAYSRNEVAGLLVIFGLTLLLEGYTKTLSTNAISTEAGASVLSWVIPLIQRKALRRRRVAVMSGNTRGKDNEDKKKKKNSGKDNDVDTSSLTTNSVESGGDGGLDFSTMSMENEISLVGNDVMQRFEEIKFTALGPQGAVGLISGIATLIHLLGFTSSLVGLSTMMMCLILNLFFANLSRGLVKRDLQAADARLTVLREVLGSIAPVKYMCWENPYLQLLDERRTAECKWILRYRLVLITSVTLGRVTSVLAAAATFSYMGWRGLPLTPNVVFAALAAFNAMRLPLIILPLFLTNLVTFSVSAKRISKYLESPEAEQLQFPATTNKIDSNDSNANVHGNDNNVILECRNACFSWGGTTRTDTIRNVHVSVSKGQLVGVVGRVGSGKTTLISGIIGQAGLTAGSMEVTRDLGYVPQKAFVLSGSVRENLLMGRQSDEKKLSKAVSAAAFDRDLEHNLPCGLESEIGEGGTTLSGGQKQRLAIARAIYADPELLLVDDALAAVDGGVAAHIWDNVFEDRRNRQKTTICTLNQTAFMPKFDTIIFFKKIDADDSVVVVQGSYHELMESDSDFAAFVTLSSSSNVDALVDEIDILHKDEIKQHQTDVKDDKADEKKQEWEGKEAKKMIDIDEEEAIFDKSPSHPSPKDKLVEEDTRHSGAVSSEALKYYFRMAGGWIWIMISCTVAIGAYGLMATTDLWLAAWVSPNNQLSVSFRATIYVVLSLGQAILIMTLSTVNACASNLASRNLHHNSLVRLLRAPIWWYEKTPSGRILSRFSGDLSMVDKIMTWLIDDVFQFSFLILALLATIIYVVPLITPVLVVGLFVFGFTILAVDRTNRQAKRETNLALSPIMTTLSESISGAPLIRAMGFEDFFLEKQLQNVNSYNKYNHFSCTTVQWLSIVTSSISFVFSLGTAILVYVKRDDFPDVTYVGVALNYSFMVPYFLSVYSMVAMYLATAITSLERILDFVVGSGKLPQEPQWNLPEDADLPKTWPSRGHVVFENVTMRYRPGLAPALKHVSFDIGSRGGEHVGVVGRTGAGKSTLAVLLFRIVEVESGRILLDGVDLSKVGVHTARKALAILPQTPLLIPGSVRHNLDPFDKTSRIRMEEVLVRVGLLGSETDVNATHDFLEHEANNLSTGEQQLLALARLLLRDGNSDDPSVVLPKVVVMDEPTANIDDQTDEKIQDVIRNEFIGSSPLSSSISDDANEQKHVTMLTIAHRLHTVIQSDRIIVMSEGSIEELDTPSNLLANENGRLSEMVRALGEGTATELKKSADTAALRKKKQL